MKIIEDESESKENDKHSSIGKARVFYNSCMNETLIEQIGDVPIRNIITDNGGWCIES